MNGAVIYLISVFENYEFPIAYATESLYMYTLYWWLTSDVSVTSIVFAVIKDIEFGYCLTKLG